MKHSNNGLGRTFLSLRPWDYAVTVVALVAAYFISRLLVEYTPYEGNPTFVFVLAVVLVSRFTEGYGLGMLASLVGVFCINYFFMYPYSHFTLSIEGYPVAFASMLITSVVISALTTRMRKKTEEAIQREQETIQLSNMNEELYRKQTEAKMEAEKEKLRYTFLQAISHDLKTPLTGIQGASSTLLAKWGDIPEDEKKKLIAGIEEDSQWLRSMTENILSITKMTAGGVDIQRTDEVAEEVVMAAVGKTRKRFPDVQIMVNIPTEVVLVKMETMLVEQVLLNLIENAIRHSGDRAHIEVGVGEDAEYAVFSVMDRGRGLVETDIDKIISRERDKMGGNIDAKRGSGIGLLVCRTIVKAHGGYIKAENREGGGAKFVFALRKEKQNGGE